MSGQDESKTGRDAVESEIPTIDLAAFLAGTEGERRLIADRVDQICRAIGFLIIKHHGFSQEISDTAWSAARAFFDLPLDAKLEARSEKPGCPRGYFPVNEESLARTRGIAAPPDLKESYSSGPLSAPAGHGTTGNFDFFYGPNIWPVEPGNFREAWMDYYRALQYLGSQVMRLLASALRLTDDYFVKFHTHELSALRALNYPSTNDTFLPGQQRAGAHSDYGSVTILKPDPSVPGLEIRLPSGKWIAAPLVSDAFIVNVGDLMARWTNDRWVSTLHRVAHPDNSAGNPTPRRQSIAYFMNPNYDAEIRAIRTCLPAGGTATYAPVLAGEYLITQFRSAN